MRFVKGDPESANIFLMFLMKKIFPKDQCIFEIENKNSIQVKISFRGGMLYFLFSLDS